MFYHPLMDNLSALTDLELEQKLTDLTRRYITAQSIGNYNLQQQVSMMMETYRNEVVNRTYAKQAKAAENKNKNEPDPFSAINVN